MSRRAYGSIVTEDRALAGHLLAASERWLLLNTWANALVIGDDAEVNRLIAFLEKRLPDVAVQHAATLQLAQDRPATLIVRNVTYLTRRNQAALMKRLEERSSIRVICTAHRAVMPLVESGRFLDTLYYRLNTLLIDLRDRSGR